MAYNNNSGGGGSSKGGLGALIVIILLAVGLYGGEDDSYTTPDNSEYIESTEVVEEDTGSEESEPTEEEPVEEESEGIIQVEPKPVEEVEPDVSDEGAGIVEAENIPTYDGETKSIDLNNGDAGFSESEISSIREEVGTTGYAFSNIDHLNRPSTAVAILTPALYNTEERDSITVNPTGWKNKRLNEGSWLYNRSHLLAYSFINADIDIIPNLITGTRDFNADRDWGMLHYEDIVREYVSEDGDYSHPDNEIMYQVTPIFDGDNLLAKGVQMRIQSLHDDSLNYNVFIYNVQDNVEFNYADGTSVDHTKKD